ncbi:hypothetical protein GCM10009608_00300 [Pseudonocardia alaniniphila]
MVDADVLGDLPQPQALETRFRHSPVRGDDQLLTTVASHSTNHLVESRAEPSQKKGPLRRTGAGLSRLGKVKPLV